MRKVVPYLFTFGLATSSLLLTGHANVLQAASPYVKSIKVLKTIAGRVDWSKAKNIIAYDYLNSDGFFEVHTMNPDQSNDQCLTCGKSELPDLHKGNPEFDPTGNWIVFQVQKAHLGLGLLDYFGNPGAGVGNDIWIMDSQGQHFWRVTDVDKLMGGSLHPHFSHAGNKLMWAERYDSKPAPYGAWNLKVADFTVKDGVPTVSNVTTFDPGGGDIFYESHGFSRDDSQIYFSSNLEGGSVYFLNIYSLDLQSGKVTNLTKTTEVWNEHAQLAPSGNGLIWMSSMNNGVPDGGDVKSDYWIMDPDGGDKSRLTYFNDPGSPDFVRNVTHVSAGDSAWSPDGTKLIATLVYNQQTFAGAIVEIDFDWTAAIVHSADFQTSVAPEAIASIFGRGLSLGIAVTQSTDLPTTLNHTSVKVKDSAGTERVSPLIFAAPTQVNYLVPAGTAAGPATVTVWIDSLQVANGTVQVGSVAPGIFTANRNGKGAPAAYVQMVAPNGTQTAPVVYQCDANGANCGPTPINISSSGDRVFLSLFATGVRGASSLEAVTVRVGTQNLPATFAGAQGQFPGLDQVVAELPKSLGKAGNVDVTLVVDGVSSNTVNINVQ